MKIFLKKSLDRQTLDLVVERETLKLRDTRGNACKSPRNVCATPIAIMEPKPPGFLHSLSTSSLN